MRAAVIPRRTKICSIILNLKSNFAKYRPDDKLFARFRNERFVGEKYY